MCSPASSDVGVDGLIEYADGSVPVSCTRSYSANSDISQTTSLSNGIRVSCG